MPDADSNVRGARSRVALARRRFLMLMGLAGAGSAVSRPLLASAQGPTPSAVTPAASTPALPDTAAADKGPSAEALALAAAVRERYGARLTDADVKQIAGELDGRLDNGRTLRKLALANGDEPDTVFQP